MDWSRSSSRPEELNLSSLSSLLFEPLQSATAPALFIPLSARLKHPRHLHTTIISQYPPPACMFHPQHFSSRKLSSVVGSCCSALRRSSACGQAPAPSTRTPHVYMRQRSPLPPLPPRHGVLLHFFPLSLSHFHRLYLFSASHPFPSSLFPPVSPPLLILPARHCFMVVKHLNPKGGDRDWRRRGGRRR